MKRKFITLFVAFLVLAGFKANAEGVVVGIETGDRIVERTGYAGQIATPNKLTFNGSKWLWATGNPVTTYGSNDRITVDNPAVNFVTFTSGTNTLTLGYKGTDYSQFVVFKSSNNAPLTDFYTTYEGNAPAANQQLTSQAFNNGNFGGYLAIQATGNVDHKDLLIVVHHRTTNELSLMPYLAYKDSLYGNVSGATVNYSPLYVQTKQMSGRWATPEDFASYKFWQFNSQGANTGGKVLTAYSAAEVEAGTSNKGYSTFTVKQVDYVKDGDVTVTNNLITHSGGAQFQGMNADIGVMPGTKNYGTHTTDSVIPLFVLATPENDCKVLSVSRINRLQTQSEGDKGYADRLEIRSYGEYFTWDKQTNGSYLYKSHAAIPSVAQNVPADSIYDAYTSLQKFAIWIDYDGRMTLYPAAAYFWKYGEHKGGPTEAENTQVDKILPNAVLVYNNITVSYEAGKSPLTDADKANGLQIGWWNGRSTDSRAIASFATMPNIRQTISDYDLCPFKPIEWEDNTIAERRFYFMEVRPDTLDAWKAPEFGGSTSTTNPWRSGGYQAGRRYVLSAQLYPAAGAGDDKFLSIVPMEVQRETRPGQQYWRLPYDSVNMAAHWEVIPVMSGTTLVGYRFINMLGDTLKYNPDPNAPSMPLVGAYKTANRLMPGADPEINAADAGVKYFGRPEHAGKPYNDVTNWFELRNTQSSASTLDTWKVHKMKGSDVFFLELVESSAVEYTLGVRNTGGFKNWANGGGVTPFYMQADNLGNYYYQQQVDLVPFNNAVMQSYPSGNHFDACPGLPINLAPIYYVPTYGPFYGDEPVNEVINTNDGAFLKQDSLTAYSFLTGFYAIQEAEDVNNTLKLSFATVPLYDGTTKTVDAARLRTTQDRLQFIELSSPIGKERADKIQALWAAAKPGQTFGDDLALLYGETYKWYIVKSGNKYLSYDFVNMQAANNRESMGMVFVNELENAVPVRLYQPLVGDKARDNFLFQFYIPNWKYVPNATTAANRVVATAFYDIESNVFKELKNGPNGDKAGRDEVCFITLAGQTDYLYATRVYTGKQVAGTRFTFEHLEGTPSTCPAEFITPQWMGEQRLLNLPVDNQIWERGKAIDAWIATDAASKAGYVNNNSATKGTTLTHTYVTTIKKYSGLPGAQASYNNPDVFKVAIPFGTTAKGDTTWIGDVVNPLPADFGVITFQTDLEVPLYRIQNDEGLYLTVVPNNVLVQDIGVTEPDVNGVTLEWRRLYDDTQVQVTAYGGDRRALQLFAISGCMGGEVDDWYGEFIYLPLASYQYDYVKDEFLKNSKDNDAIFYNFELCKAMQGYDATGNDVRDCWRVAQHTPTGPGLKHMIIGNSNAEAIAGNWPAIQVKWSKFGYQKPQCESFLVKNVNTVTSTSNNKYYVFDGPSVTAADSCSLFAHWSINYNDVDTFLAKFTPELKSVYGTLMDEKDGDVNQTNLKGEYYFVKKIEGKENTYRAIDVSGYNSNNFVAKFDTLELTCTNHAVPFFDLEKDGHFNLYEQLAIIESIYVNRNLSSEYVDIKTGDPIATPIYRPGSTAPYAYRTYINDINGAKEGNYDDAEFLTVYKQNRRELTKDHVIPYYSFSVTREGVEYFLNVETIQGRDSVYWTALSKEKGGKYEQLILSSNDNTFPTYKFCLPYEVKSNGQRADSVAYGAKKYPPVYLQTLDTAKDDYPYLIVAGSATNYVTARKLNDAILDTQQATLKWNIYTVDYRHIDEVKVTSWIFGGQMPQGNIWVPIADAIENGSAQIALTNYRDGKPGIAFITDTGKDPNYGTLGAAENLTIEFKGDTVIGTYAPRPIWYYRIKVGNDYLTDAFPQTDPKFNYFFGGENYDYGYFTKGIDPKPAFAAQGINADAGFIQTFGFRYVTNDMSEGQEFFIVSRADYTLNQEENYRYLAQINDRFVFVEDKELALKFQWGEVDADGNYTDLEIVGTGGIYGVQGGIKFLNTTGKVDVYSIDGRLIKTAVLTGGEQTIPATRGIVVVKNGGQTVKVVVK